MTCLCSEAPQHSSRVVACMAPYAASLWPWPGWIKHSHHCSHCVRHGQTHAAASRHTTPESRWYCVQRRAVQHVRRPPATRVTISPQPQARLRHRQDALAEQRQQALLSSLAEAQDLAVSSGQHSVPDRRNWLTSQGSLRAQPPCATPTAVSESPTPPPEYAPMMCWMVTRAAVHAHFSRLPDRQTARSAFCSTHSCCC